MEDGTELYLNAALFRLCNEQDVRAVSRKAKKFRLHFVKADPVLQVHVPIQFKKQFKQFVCDLRFTCYHTVTGIVSFCNCLFFIIVVTLVYFPPEGARVKVPPLFFVIICVFCVLTFLLGCKA